MVEAVPHKSIEVYMYSPAIADTLRVSVQGQSLKPCETQETHYKTATQFQEQVRKCATDERTCDQGAER